MNNPTNTDEKIIKYRKYIERLRADAQVGSNRCVECGGLLIKTSSGVVCGSCGLEHSNLNIFERVTMPSDEFNNNGPGFYVGKIPSRLSNLGSQIGLQGSAFMADHNGKPLNGLEKKYARLSKIHNSLSKSVFQEKNLRAINLINNVGKMLDLAQIIIDQASYYYKKIIKTEVQIKNHVTLAATCLLQAVKENSSITPVSLTEFITAFQQAGHHLNAHILIRDTLKYQSFFNKNQIKTSEHYLNRLISAVLENEEVLSSLERKKWDKNQYEHLLRKTCRKILENLPPSKRGGRNPFILAGAVIYCADKLVAKKMGKKSVLTQRTAAIAMDITEYSIREHFVKVLKPLFIRPMR